MLIFNYATKKAMRECIGQPLKFIETSVFGAEYKKDGMLTGCNRPHITGHSREFFAQVEMRDGLIKAVK